MADQTHGHEDELDFPQTFLQQVEDLARRTDDGDAWAKLMYQDWFVCPTSRLADTLEISVCRRRQYVPHGSDTSDRVDVVVDSYGLGEASCQAHFELPHISLRQLILKSIDHLMDLSSADVVVADDDKAVAMRLLDDIESEVASALAELRSRLK